MKRFLAGLLATLFVLAVSVGTVRADARPALDQDIAGTFRIIVRHPNGDTFLCTAFSIGPDQTGHVSLITAGHCADGAVDSFVYMGKRVYSIVWQYFFDAPGDDWALGTTNLPIDTPVAINSLRLKPLEEGDHVIMVGYSQGSLTETVLVYTGEQDQVGNAVYYCENTCPNEGMSGSAIVDSYGNLVGVMTVGYAKKAVDLDGRITFKRAPFVGGTTIQTMLSDIGY